MQIRIFSWSRVATEQTHLISSILKLISISSASSSVSESRAEIELESERISIPYFSSRLSICLSASSLKFNALTYIF